jgi:hypothetical protein
MKKIFFSLMLLILSTASTLNAQTNTFTNVNVTGNLGVGTTTPQYLFEAVGNKIGLTSPTNVNADLMLLLNHKASLTYFNTEYANGLYINKNWSSSAGYFSDFYFISLWGNVGIGTDTPQYPLESMGNMGISAPSGTNIDLKFLMNHKTVLAYFNTEYANGLYINRNWSSGTGFFNDFDFVSIWGNVGIGRSDPYYKLDVAGTIRAHEVKVNLNTGADFVFEKDYNLMPLNELSNFIQENKHLPEIAPATEMTATETDLGEMQVKLLQKIEELTLHVIRQNNKIEKLETELNILKTK